MHNGKSLMQSEIALEQFYFKAFFASSEFFSRLSQWQKPKFHKEKVSLTKY